MGIVLACCSRNKSTDNDDADQKKPVASKSIETEPSNLHESNTNIHTAEEILDDNFKTQITEAIGEHMASVPTSYETKRDLIVKEMKSLAPERYLGLSFTEYPDVNGPTVNEMARRFVTSNEVKQRLIDQINERIESSLQSQTADWNSSSQEAARSDIKTFIEKHVNEAFDHVQLAQDFYDPSKQ